MLDGRTKSKYLPLRSAFSAILSSNDRILSDFYITDVIEHLVLTFIGAAIVFNERWLLAVQSHL